MLTIKRLLVLLALFLVPIHDNSFNTAFAQGDGATAMPAAPAVSISNDTLQEFRDAAQTAEPGARLGYVVVGWDSQASSDFSERAIDIVVSNLSEDVPNWRTGELPTGVMNDFLTVWDVGFDEILTGRHYWFAIEIVAAATDRLSFTVQPLAALNPIDHLAPPDLELFLERFSEFFNVPAREMFDLHAVTAVPPTERTRNVDIGAFAEAFDTELSPTLVRALEASGTDNIGHHQIVFATLLRLRMMQQLRLASDQGGFAFHHIVADPTFIQLAVDLLDFGWTFTDTVTYMNSFAAWGVALQTQLFAARRNGNSAGHYEARLAAYVVNAMAMRLTADATLVSSQQPRPPMAERGALNAAAILARRAQSAQRFWRHHAHIIIQPIIHAGHIAVDGPWKHLSEAEIAHATRNLRLIYEAVAFYQGHDVAERLVIDSAFLQAFRSGVPTTEMAPSALFTWRYTSTSPSGFTLGGEVGSYFNLLTANYPAADAAALSGVNQATWQKLVTNGTIAPPSLVKTLDVPTLEILLGYRQWLVDRGAMEPELRERFDRGLAACLDDPNLPVAVLRETFGIGFNDDGSVIDRTLPETTMRRLAVAHAGREAASRPISRGTQLIALINGSKGSTFRSPSSDALQPLILAVDQFAAKAAQYGHLDLRAPLVRIAETRFATRR